MWLLVLNVQIRDSEGRFCMRELCSYDIQYTIKENMNFSYVKEIQFFLSFKCVNFVVDK